MMINQNIKEKISQFGMTYDEYNKLFIEQIENTNPELLNQEQNELYEYKKLNLQRSRRIEKNYVPSEEIKYAARQINEYQLWVVVTEPWCGDSAQSLPYMAKIAALNDKINLRIILRDSNPDIMDAYLTNGTKSIPKLAAYDKEWNELFLWGPRPKAAYELLKKLKEEGIVKPELYEKLHLWYGRNRGKDLEFELIKMLSGVEKV